MAVASAARMPMAFGCCELLPVQPLADFVVHGIANAALQLHLLDPVWPAVAFKTEIGI